MMALSDSTPPPAPRGATFTTSAHDERAPTDPSAALRPADIAGLRWFFGEHESDLGIRSTFGAQLEGALAQRMSDEARREARQMSALLSQLRKGRMPKGVAREFAERIGLVRDGQKIRIELLGGEYIYQHAPTHPPPPDPFESDRVLVLVRRANQIRTRLRAIGENHTKVLNAVYGPATHGEGREQLRKRLGDLVEVAVAIVASQRTDKDPPARAMVRAKLTDDSFVRMLKHAAGGYLRAAARAYAETRS